MIRCGEEVVQFMLKATTNAMPLQRRSLLNNKPAATLEDVTSKAVGVHVSQVFSQV